LTTTSGRSKGGGKNSNERYTVNLLTVLQNRVEEVGVAGVFQGGFQHHRKRVFGKRMEREYDEQGEKIENEETWSLDLLDCMGEVRRREKQDDAYETELKKCFGKAPKWSKGIWALDFLWRIERIDVVGKSQRAKDAELKQCWNDAMQKEWERVRKENEEKQKEKNAKSKGKG
ncbi:MAG: hypothetical protein FWD76_00935, partial [Firmicutes bacterium]|nr:hypothetical protein [Bacillota bacterium]